MNDKLRIQEFVPEIAAGFGPDYRDTEGTTIGCLGPGGTAVHPDRPVPLAIREIAERLYGCCPQYNGDTGACLLVVGTLCNKFLRPNDREFSPEKKSNRP